MIFPCFFSFDISMEMYPMLIMKNTWSFLEFALESWD
jgi:hypothetical protein